LPPDRNDNGSVTGAFEPPQFRSVRKGLTVEIRGQQAALMSINAKNEPETSSNGDSPRFPNGF
jgi:hypothetical protein